MPLGIGIGISPTLGTGVGGTAAPASIINSIQEVTATIANSATTGDVTINSVDTTKCELLSNGYTSAYNSGDNASRNRESRALLNATTLRSTRGVAPPSAVSPRTTIVEYKAAALKSIQSGLVSVAPGDVTKDVTITTVGDLTRSVAIQTGLNSSTTARNITEVQYGLALTGASTVRFYGSGTGGAAGAQGATITGNAGWMVTEHDPSAVDVVQQYSYRENTSSGLTSFTVTLSPSVDETRSSIVIGGVICNSANGYQSHQFRHELQTGGASVLLTRNGANTHDKTMFGAARTWKAGVLASAPQRGTISLLTGTSVAATISDIGTTNGYANWCNPSGPAANDNQVFSDLARTNGTTLTATIQVANGAGGPIVPYEALKYA